MNCIGGGSDSGSIDSGSIGRGDCGDDTVRESHTYTGSLVSYSCTYELVCISYAYVIYCIIIYSFANAYTVYAYKI